MFRMTASKLDAGTGCRLDICLLVVPVAYVQPCFSIASEHLKIAALAPRHNASNLSGVVGRCNSCLAVACTDISAVSWECCQDSNAAV